MYVIVFYNSQEVRNSISTVGKTIAKSSMAAGIACSYTTFPYEKHDNQGLSVLYRSQIISIWIKLWQIASDNISIVIIWKEDRHLNGSWLEPWEAGTDKLIPALHSVSHFAGQGPLVGHEDTASGPVNNWQNTNILLVI